MVNRNSYLIVDVVLINILDPLASALASAGPIDHRAIRRIRLTGRVRMTRFTHTVTVTVHTGHWRHQSHRPLPLDRRHRLWNTARVFGHLLRFARRRFFGRRHRRLPNGSGHFSGTLQTGWPRDVRYVRADSMRRQSGRNRESNLGAGPHRDAALSVRGPDLATYSHRNASSSARRTDFAVVPQ